MRGRRDKHFRDAMLETIVECGSPDGMAAEVHSMRPPSLSYVRQGCRSAGISAGRDRRRRSTTYRMT
jgi:hypothetical protein